MSAAILGLDFETASLLSLEDCGSSRYAADPSLVVTVVAWAFDDGPVKSALLPSPLPDEIEQHIRAGGVIRAWNATFESDIITKHFNVPLAPEQIDCTQQRAMYSGLPASLGEAGEALRLNILKDAKARSLMLQMARPRVNKGGVVRWWHNEDRAKLEALEAYCVRDVEAERAISNIVPQLPPREREIALLDRRINRRGVLFDLPLVRQMMTIAEEETERLNARATEITNGEITNPGTQHKRMADFFADVGIASFAKGVLPDLLKRTDLSPLQRELLELRASGAKSSVAKLSAILEYADEDGACRNMLKYYGAHSGRFSAKGPQPHNLPRGSIKNPDAAIDSIVSGMDAHGLSLFYGAPMDVVSSCIRGTIIPRPGNVFIGFDFSQIESRLTAYLCGQQDLVEEYRRGNDVYQYTADKLGLPDRQSGKACTLGLGFQLGAKKFVDFAAAYGLEFSMTQSEEIVQAWRESNSSIRNTWYALDDAMKQVIREAQDTDNKTSIRKVGRHFTIVVRPARNGSPVLSMLLPSGRSLYYRDVKLLPRQKFGKETETIVYSGHNPLRKRFELSEGDLGVEHFGGRALENAVQGVARDIMCEAMLAIEAAGYPVTLTIHDEILAEAPASEANAAFDKIHEIMKRTPEWCEGLPLGAEGDIMRRFKK